MNWTVLIFSKFLKILIFNIEITFFSQLISYTHSNSNISVIIIIFQRNHAVLQNRFNNNLIMNFECTILLFVYYLFKFYLSAI